MNRSLRNLIIALALFVTTAWAQSPPKEPGAATDTGVKAYQSYGGARENISLSNGNLNLTIPLVSLKGRNGFDTDVSLVYESKNWKIDEVYTEGVNYSPGVYDDIWQPETRWSNISYGWHLNIPTLDSNTEANYDIGTCSGSSIVTLPDGGKYYFSNAYGCGNQATVSDADDSSGMRLDLGHTGGPVAIMRNGTHIYFPSAFQGVATKMEDANGNYINYGTGGVGITDSLGRSITFTTYGDEVTSVSYKDSSGTTRTITIGWTGTTFTGTMATPTSNLHRWVHYANLSTYGGWAMPGSVTYPNGLGFTFAYNGYGDLSKITYPTGGYTAYDYVAPSHADRVSGDGWLYADFREVSARHVCRNTNGACASGQEDTTTYTATIGTNANATDLPPIKWST